MLMLPSSIVAVWLIDSALLKARMGSCYRIGCYRKQRKIHKSKNVSLCEVYKLKKKKEIMFPEWSLVLRAVMWESFTENGSVGAVLVWADWRKAVQMYPRLRPGGVMLGTSWYNPKAETKIFTPVSDLLHLPAHQLVSSTVLNLRSPGWVI